ncbi:hypothetical protein [Beggiatoa leptomitoformis]|uniref:Uncharacterized protein n=1 Tax=Beggiatoa leptomitoformis TaxID=288004 RepID=A0A2N9YCB9_9GAMM|nr:hypothetical protein [Beggiatoa leptomitoformis]ALG66607.1 hypothetical protein AL038_01240 [Beggiatoa leptomitoformis]AUI68082.1 hypothetical protein BLE401_04785 [Beggiatoa leptomitoformis]
MKIKIDDTLVEATSLFDGKWNKQFNFEKLQKKDRVYKLELQDNPNLSPEPGTYSDLSVDELCKMTFSLGNPDGYIFCENGKKHRVYYEHVLFLMGYGASIDGSPVISFSARHLGDDTLPFFTISIIK